LRIFIFFYFLLSSSTTNASLTSHSLPHTHTYTHTHSHAHTVARRIPVLARIRGSRLVPLIEERKVSVKSIGRISRLAIHTPIFSAPVLKTATATCPSPVTGNDTTSTTATSCATIVATEAKSAEAPAVAPATATYLSHTCSSMLRTVKRTK